jgi:peptidoglycan/LPS O-acetylase OafA/YrhL
MLKLASIADKNIHLASIDGLRGIAVLMVLAVHTSQRVGNVAIGSFSSPTLEQFINAGARGVQLFFLLSAFTLFRSSKIKFDREMWPRRNFYIRRAFRILPLWWLVTALYTVLGNGDFMASVPSFLMYFGFIRYAPGVDIFPLGWSIFTEETFYLLLPLIFGFVTSIRRACMFFMALLSLALVWRVFAPSFSVPNQGEFIFLFPLSHWFCFGLGILLFLIYEQKSWKA